MTIGSSFHSSTYGDGEVISVTEYLFVVRFDQPPGMVKNVPNTARIVPSITFYLDNA